MALASDYMQVAPQTGAGPAMLGMGTGTMPAPLQAGVSTTASYGASANLGGSAIWLCLIFGGLALWYHVLAK